MERNDEHGLAREARALAKNANRELKEFRRLRDKEWLGGVCAGIAYRLGAPTWVVRLTWFLLSWFYGFGLVAYVLLWIFVPGTNATPRDYARRTGDRD